MANVFYEMEGKVLAVTSYKIGNSYTFNVQWQRKHSHSKREGGGVAKKEPKTGQNLAERRKP